MTGYVPFICWFFRLRNVHNDHDETRVMTDSARLCDGWLGASLRDDLSHPDDKIKTALVQHWASAVFVFNTLQEQNYGLTIIVSLSSDRAAAPRATPVMANPSVIVSRGSTNNPD